MPEQFERIVEVLHQRGLLDRCTSIAVEGVQIQLQPVRQEPPRAERDPKEVVQPGPALFSALTQAFPGAAVPRSLKGGG